MTRNALTVRGGLPAKAGIAERQIAKNDSEIIDLQPLPSEGRWRRIWRAIFVVLGFALFLIHATRLLMGSHPLWQ